MLVKVNFILLVLAVVGSIAPTSASVDSDLGDVHEQIISESDAKWVKEELVKKLIAAIFFDEKKCECQNIESNNPSSKPAFPYSKHGSYDKLTKCYQKGYCDSKDYLLRHGYILLGNNYYYFSTVAKTWHEASLFCQQNGSQLAHPMNQQENDYLRTYVRANFMTTSTGWYFGANDILNEKQWVWYGTNTSVSFTDWGPGQPDNNGNIQHCAHYWKDSQWKWDDWWCYLPLNFICQADPYTYKICS